MCRLQILLLRCAGCRLQSSRCVDVQMCNSLRADVARANHEGCGANHQERLKPLISALLGGRASICWTTSNCSPTLSVLTRGGRALATKLLSDCSSMAMPSQIKDWKNILITIWPLWVAQVSPRSENVSKWFQFCQELWQETIRLHWP